MAQGTTPVVQRRQLQPELREVCHEARYTQKQAADEMGCSSSRMIGPETRAIAVSTTDAMASVHFYKNKGDVRVGSLIAVARSTGHGMVGRVQRPLYAAVLELPGLRARGRRHTPIPDADGVRSDPDRRPRPRYDVGPPASAEHGRRQDAVHASGRCRPVREPDFLAAKLVRNSVRDRCARDDNVESACHPVRYKPGWFDPIATGNGNSRYREPAQSTVTRIDHIGRPTKGEIWLLTPSRQELRW
jgi:hypothetical protein